MAVYSGWGWDFGTLSASGDLSDEQYHFVELANNEGYVRAATGASGPIPFGVLQNDPEDGEPAQVRVLGVTQVYADAASPIGVGDFVTSGSDGQAILAVGSNAAGVALKGLSSGSGVLIEVMLTPGATRTADNTP